jgi:hypothetical protein
MVSKLISCDFCKKSDFEELYKPFYSRKNAKILVCENCGLCFSQYGSTTHSMNNFFGASFGPHRSGKSLLANEVFQDLSENLVLTDSVLPLNCLVVGAQDQEAFLPKIKTFFSSVDFLEPDFRFKPSKMSTVRTFQVKFEDFITDTKYSCVIVPHTLEHLEHPSIFFSQVRRLMTKESLIYLSVPDLEVVRWAEGNLTEYFLDKHKFHFDKYTLKNYFHKYGFEILKSYEASPNNFRSLSIIARISEKQKNAIELENRLNSKVLVNNYADAMEANSSFANETIRNMNEFIRHNAVAGWGMGRIFLEYASRGIELAEIDYFLDSNIDNCRYVEKLMNIKILSTKDFASISRKVNYIIVFSDVFFEEIIDFAPLRSSSIKFLSYRDFSNKEKMLECDFSQE